MDRIRVWLDTRGRMITAGLVAGTFLACGDPVSIRGDKSTVIVLAGLVGTALIVRLVRPLASVLAA